MWNNSELRKEFKEITYPRHHINDHTLDDNLPFLQARPDDEQSHPPPTTDVGALKAIPLELFWAILFPLDLRTIAHLRLVNRRAREIVDSFPELKTVVTRAPNAIRGILSIGSGRFITFARLYEKLSLYTCENCGEFGGYLYLITCWRVCFLCFTHGEQFLPLRRKHACRKFGLDRETVDALPGMKPLPGTYSPEEHKVDRPSVLVDYGAAMRAGYLRHGSFSAMRKYVRKKRRARREREADDMREEGGTQQPSELHAQQVRRPRLRDPVDVDEQVANPLRFVAIVRVPWLDLEEREVNWGFYCSGCKDSPDSAHWDLHRRHQFTADTFYEHLEKYGDVMDGRHHVDWLSNYTHTSRARLESLYKRIPTLGTLTVTPFP